MFAAAIALTYLTCITCHAICCLPACLPPLSACLLFPPLLPALPGLSGACGSILLYDRNADSAGAYGSVGGVPSASSQCRLTGTSGYAGHKLNSEAGSDGQLVPYVGPQYYQLTAVQGSAIPSASGSNRSRAQAFIQVRSGAAVLKLFPEAGALRLSTVTPIITCCECD